MKHRHRKLLALLLALCLLAAALPLSASAAQYGGSCGQNLTWSIDGNVLTISGSGPMNDYRKASDQPWYKYRKPVTKVVVNSGVTTIGENAFRGMDMMTATLPDTLTKIGDDAFYSCEELTGITIPSGVTSIGEAAFGSCTNLSYATIPDTVTIIDEIAFDGCENLTEINLPDGLKTIGRIAFRDTGLTSVTIPGGATIGTSAFLGSALTSVTLESGVTSIPDSAFARCEDLKYVSIPNTVQSLEDESFYWCRALESISLPDSVKTIGDSAFYYCDALVNVSLGNGIETIGYRAFRACDSLREITVPSTCTSIGGEAFYTYYPMTITVLSPNCRINTLKNTMGTVGMVTIRGYKGSTSEAYALEHGYAFEVLPEQSTEEPDPPTGFKDVYSSDYYYQPVLWAVENEITAGTSATTFSPNQNCTRAQAMTFLWRAEGCPEPRSTNNPFVDVKPDAYYYKAVLWAVEKKVTAGVSATQFAPDEECTRGQIMTFIHRAAGSPSVSGSSPFRDVKTSDYFYRPILWAVKNNITNGISATEFGPSDGCTRGQIVTFLYRHYA